MGGDLTKLKLIKIRYLIEDNLLSFKYSYPAQRDKAAKLCLKLWNKEIEIQEVKK